MGSSLLWKGTFEYSTFQAVVWQWWHTEPQEITVCKKCDCGALCWWFTCGAELLLPTVLLCKEKKRNTIHRAMFTPLPLNLSCSLVSAFTDMASKCHLEMFLEITDGKWHPRLRQGQCYVNEGQFLQCSDSSVSIGAASARNHVPWWIVVCCLFSHSQKWIVQGMKNKNWNLMLDHSPALVTLQGFCFNSCCVQMSQTRVRKLPARGLGTWHFAAGGGDGLPDSPMRGVGYGNPELASLPWRWETNDEDGTTLK